MPELAGEVGWILSGERGRIEGGITLPPVAMAGDAGGVEFLTASLAQDIAGCDASGSRKQE